MIYMILCRRKLQVQVQNLGDQHWKWATSKRKWATTTKRLRTPATKAAACKCSEIPFSVISWLWHGMDKQGKATSDNVILLFAISFDIWRKKKQLMLKLA